MQKILLLAVALAAVWNLAAQSRTEEFTVKSTILGVEKTCSVYLPDGYNESELDYPGLYLLHGANGGHTWRCWQMALPGVLTFVSVGFMQ